MRRATENQGNSRTLAECCPPRSKVKDHTLQQRSLSHVMSFLQETPMKPSQVPNKLPHPPPRRMLPLQSPEPCHRDRTGPPWHPPPPHLKPRHSSGCIQSGPANIGSSANGSFLTPVRDRLGPLHQPLGSPFSRLVPFSQSNGGATVNSNFHAASPQFMMDLSNYSTPSHIRRDEVTGSKVTLPSSGNKKTPAQRQDASKVQYSDVRNHIQTVELHRPPITPSLCTRRAQEVYPLPYSHVEHGSPGGSHLPPRGHQPASSTYSSDRGGGSSLPIMHSPVTPSQDQQHKRTPTSEKLHPAMEVNNSSQKRCREFEESNPTAKKLCFQSENFAEAQTPKVTVGSSVNTPTVSQQSSWHSSVSDRKPPCTDSVRGQSADTEPPSTFKPTQLSCASLTSSSYIKHPPMGAKQAYINYSHNNTVRLIELKSPSKSVEEGLKKRMEDKSSCLPSSEVPQKDALVSPHFQAGSHNAGHTHHSTPVSSVKTPSRNNQVDENKKSESSKPTSKPSSQSCRAVERSKAPRPRRIIPAPDIGELFTPDPMTYVIKTAKPKTDGGMNKSSTSDKSCPSRTASSSNDAVTASSCLSAQNSTVTGPHSGETKGLSSSLSEYDQHILLPTVILKRVKLENLKHFSPKERKLKTSPDVTPSSRLPRSEKQTSPLHNTSQTGVDGSGDKQPVNEEDPIDMELNLGLSFAVELDVAESSYSSDEEQLLSLQEMMQRARRPPDTPEKGAFSEPSTPGHHSCPPKTQPLPTNTKMGTYKNNLDQMLKEINNNKRTTETQTRLLNACKEELLRIAEYEEAEKNREEGISTEQQEFLQRFSLMSCAIREVPPGEVVFHLEKFGRLFDHNTLQLRQCMVSPQGMAQKTLLWSSSAQLKLHVNIGLFQEAYDSNSPCPVQVTRFLFKMMSVHNEKMVSGKILQTLCDIACTAANQIVNNRSQKFQVWVPSLADLALVLINMGATFVTLFPFENLQPPFTEGDLLEDIHIKSQSPSSNTEQSPFPEDNYNNILKYLSFCMALCPRAYTDTELLLLLTVVGRVSLDTQLIPQSSVELYPLQCRIVNNIRDWNTTLPRICLALTDLTDDHHNMCLLVQLLPDNTRGKQLRRHLSLSMISKLLDGSCTYTPTRNEFQLSELRPYLRRMQPSSLLRGMQRSSSRARKDNEDGATLDEQSYYLCYSLLTLANEASNFQFFPAHQKEQLLSLCSELEMHVKCDIRESEKCLYRSKVKDLVARITTKWQILLLRTRPLHGKLYDYWQPLPASSSQKEQEMDCSGHGERPVAEEEEEEEHAETSASEEEEEEGGDRIDDSNETGDHTKSEEEEEVSGVDNTNETEQATELSLESEV